MSHAQSVYFREGLLPSVRDWQAVIDKHGFAVALDPRWQLRTSSGNLPTRYRGEATGFECDLAKVGDDERAELPETLDAGVAQLALAFTSRGELSFAAAFVAAACFAELTGGTLFDWQSGDAFSAEEAMALALDHDADREGDPADEAAPPVPLPRDLVRIDAGAKQLNAAVLVAGSGAKRFVETIRVATRGEAQAAHSDEGIIDHFVMSLGEIRGWSPRLFFYAVDDAPVALETFARWSPDAAALVLALDGPDEGLSPTLAALAHAARPADAVVAFVGPTAAADAWAREAGARAAVEAPFDDAAAMATLKQIARRVLGSLRAP